MKTRLLISILTIASLTSCQPDREKIIEADLYFKLFDIERFYDSPDSSLTKIENLVQDINKDTDNKRKDEFEHFKFMVDNNLLRRQFIWLRMDNGENRILFLDSLEYNKFKNYRWSDLTKEKTKIRIKAIARDFKYPYYFEDTETAYDCVKMLTISKINGETYWTK